MRPAIYLACYLPHACKQADIHVLHGRTAFAASRQKLEPRQQVCCKAQLPLPPMGKFKPPISRRHSREEKAPSHLLKVTQGCANRLHQLPATSAGAAGRRLRAGLDTAAAAGAAFFQPTHLQLFAARTWNPPHQLSHICEPFAQDLLLPYDPLATNNLYHQEPSARLSGSILSFKGSG